MQRKRITLATISLGFITGVTLSLGACRGSEPDEDHCARLGGNAACAEKFGDERPYCMMCDDPALDNDGCTAEEPTNLECYSPCGDMQNYTENSSCLEVGDGDGDGDGEPMMCMGSEDCADLATPFCNINTGECVACDELPESDALCSSLGDGSTPVCVDAVCVECAAGQEQACEGVTPVCDDGANTCVGCDAHEQCPDSACNIAVGNCIDPSSIIHVDGDNPCGTGDGSEASPYCSIEEALENAGTEVMLLLHENFNDDPYLEQVSVATQVAVFAAPGQEMRVQGTGGNPAFTITPTGALYMRGVRVTGATVEGIRVNGGSAWVERTRVVNNSGGAIVVDGGSLVLTNSFVGGDQSDQRAVHVIDGSVDINDVTLAAGFGAAVALFCDDGSTTTVRNSLLVARTDSDELACPDVTITTSALEMDVAGNTELGPLDTNWFVNYLSGDLHLSGTHPPVLETAATWITGDPVNDIDGDPRPTTDGAPDVAGADVP